ncbi:TrkH family potassium uptake protein [Pseudodesulfovibrio pelocollis]|uniref:TrkH family potassium uptake protein n=1 Tax=Pseudodesulfovibrio pelocollis TaxID=3051432 RepID=UPI00255B1E91|nr:potassium transporter TrkG [Pseudodesulfovibrio sp. SB368]
MRSRLLSPYWMPVWLFAGAIAVGATLLRLDTSHPGGPISLLDAVFTATSAVCVTGLVVVDTGSYFSLFGQHVILVLFQLGGLGMMTFTTLILHLMGKHVSLGDRIAVSQSLLHDPSFSLPRFLGRVVGWVLALEAVGALCLWLMDPVGFSPYSAVFHSVSAFCNAGFSLYPDSLTQWQGHVGINMVFMLLITAGGLGFFVLNECAGLVKSVLLGRRPARRGSYLLSWHSTIVLRTSLFLVVAGAAVIFVAEGVAGTGPADPSTRLLTSLFQSVTCRTAGFNTVDIGMMSNVSLVFMMALMFIGGSPGSCAGGIKTTSFRALWGFVLAQFRGRDQVRVGRYALSQSALNTVFSLFIIATILVAVGTIALTSLETVGHSYLMGRDKFMVNMFEVISAFCTVGLSTGLTASLNGAEKGMIVVLMFVGRLGPMWLLSALHSWQTECHYRVPTENLPLG